jgi:ATP-dependent helicase/nuclease subunit B
VAARLAVSASNRLRLDWAGEHLNSIPRQSEVLVLASSRTAADDFIRSSLSNGRGRLGVHRFTLDQLARELAAGAQLNHASGVAREALAIRSAWQLGLERGLTYFKPVADTPGFARALVRTLTELRAMEIDAEALEKAGEPGGDLSRLLRGYSAEMHERHLVDDAAVFAAAVSHPAHRFAGLPLFLIDLGTLSSCERHLVASLASRSPAVFATACAGDTAAIDVLSKLLDAEPEFLADAAATSLDRVRGFIFSPQSPEAQPTDGTLEFFSAAGEGLECVEIARRILALAREGTPFDRVAILLRNPFDYLPLMEDALRRTGIPVWTTRDSGRPDARGRAFLALLDCAAAGLTASGFAEYLSLGQSPEDAGAPAGWEKMLVDAAVIGGRDRWARRLGGLEAEFRLRLADLAGEEEALRSHLERQIERLARLRLFALPVIHQLDALPNRAPWSEWIAALAQLAEKTLRDPEPVLDLLDELRPLAEVGPVSLQEVRAVLAERLRFLQREPPESRFGCVFVCTPLEVAARSFSVVFVPGLAEGVFPRKTVEDPLLLDEWRRLLSPELTTREALVSRERLLLRYAAGAAESKLVVSYPRVDVMQGRPRVPSFYALEVLRAAEGRLPELREIETRAAHSVTARLGWPAPDSPASAIDDAEYDLAVLEPLRKQSGGDIRGRGRFLMDANPHLGRSLRSRWRRWKPDWSAADGLLDSSAGTRAVLAAHRLRARSYSASALQHFAACPYRFFLYAIHQLHPREEKAPLERMDPLTRGAVFHRAQFCIHRELHSAGLLPITSGNLPRILDVADHAFNTVVAEQAENLAPAIPRVWSSEVESLRADLHTWIREVAAAPPRWRPAHFELGFGLEHSEERDPASTTQEVVVLDGFRLRGSIDLVEAHTTVQGFRVTDHKTGKPPQKPPVTVGAGEILQPMLYALAAEQLLHGPVQSSLLYYCTQCGDYTQHSVYVGEEARETLAEVLETIDLAVEKGFLPASPRDKACDFCDYRVICGPYEQERTARKDQRALAPLIRVRDLR